jgi:hypothetical protein
LQTEKSVNTPAAFVQLDGAKGSHRRDKDDAEGFRKFLVKFFLKLQFEVKPLYFI